MAGKIFRFLGMLGRFLAVVLVAWAMALSFLLIAQRIFNPFHVVLSDSMSPQIKTGDAVIVKDIEPANVQLGQVVIFHDPGKKEDLIIHRVVGVETRNGIKFFATKGDNNETRDNWEISMGEVVGGVAVTLPRFGKFLDFVSRPRGYLSLIVIPALASLLLAMLLGIIEKVVGFGRGRRQRGPSPTSEPY